MKTVAGTNLAQQAYDIWSKGRRGSRDQLRATACSEVLITPGKSEFWRIKFAEMREREFGGRRA